MVGWLHLNLPQIRPFTQTCWLPLIQACGSVLAAHRQADLLNQVSCKFVLPDTSLVLLNRDICG